MIRRRFSLRRFLSPFRQRIFASRFFRRYSDAAKLLMPLMLLLYMMPCRHLLMPFIFSRLFSLLLRLALLYAASPFAAFVADDAAATLLDAAISFSPHTLIGLRCRRQLMPPLFYDDACYAIAAIISMMLRFVADAFSRCHATPASLSLLRCYAYDTPAMPLRHTPPLLLRH